ncbi:MAG: DUF697 domain-containing protein [Pseudolabrys sp.]
MTTEEAATPEQPSADERRDTAEKLVKRMALWSGAAGMIPVPFVDMATVGGVQIQMLRRLSRIYDVPFSENRGKSLVAALAGATIPATSGLGAASLLKGLPIAGTIVGALAMPTLSAGASISPRAARCSTSSRRTIASSSRRRRKSTRRSTEASPRPRAPEGGGAWHVIPKSGHRFSEKIMRPRNVRQAQ